MSRLRRALTRRRSVSLFGGAWVLLVVAISGGAGTFAALTASDSNNGNTISSGTVALADNDGGAALLGFSDATPGTSDTGCIKVTYSGSLPATVRIYGSTTGTGLAPYLRVTVTRGVYNGTEPAFKSCTNFQADATDYIGAGAGVVYSGTLDGFPTSHATGITDAHTSAVESWTTGESHVYRIRVELGSDTAGQGKNATQSFTWEARNQ